MIRLKKLLSLLLTCCLITALLPAVSMSAGAAASVQRTASLNLTNVWKDVSNSSEKWSWDASEQTLTLSGVDFYSQYSNAVILPSGSKIVVNGNNIIKALSNSNGIYSDGGLTISGDGSLDIYGGNNAIHNLAYLDISIADLTAVGHTYSAIMCKKNQYHSAEDGDVNINLTGNLTASGINGRSVRIKTGGDINTNLPDYIYQSIEGWNDGVEIDAGGLINSRKISVGYYDIDGQKQKTTEKIQISGTIPSGASVVLEGNVEIPYGKTLVNNGDIKIDNLYIANLAPFKSTFIKYGTFINNGTVTPDSSATAAAANIYINGVNILQAPDYTVTCGPGTAVYTPINNTLTLTDAAIDGVFTAGDGTTYGIYADGPLNIAAAGNNIIGSNSAPTYGIYISGSVNSSGTGSIVTAGEKAGLYIDQGSFIADNYILAKSTGDGSAAVAIKQGRTSPVYISPTQVLVSRKNAALYTSSEGDFSYKTYGIDGSHPYYNTSTGFTGAAKQAELNTGAEYAENGDTTDLTFKISPVRSSENKTKDVAIINAAAFDASIANTASGTTKLNLTVSVAIDSDISKLDVVLPNSLQAAAANRDLSLAIKSDLGTLTYDNSTLQSIFGGAGGSDIKASIGYMKKEDLNPVQQAEIGSDFDSSIFVKTGISKADGGNISFAGQPNLEMQYMYGYYETENGIYIDNLNEYGAYKNQEFTLTYDDQYYNVVYLKFPVSNNDVSIISYDYASGYEHPYTDTPADAWYLEPVIFVTINNLMTGTGETQFSPNVTTTRGMLVTILYRLEGEPDIASVTAVSDFNDVPSSAYYSKAVAWAAANQIVNGYGDKFKPNDTLTREQMVTILYRYAQYKGYDVSLTGSLGSFGDSGTVQAYARPAMEWAAANGIITGSSNMILPRNGATRAQIAAILERFILNVMV